MTDGRSPLMTPMIEGGILVSQWSQMLEIKPTNATGMAQKTTRAVTNPTTPSLRTTRCHHEIFKDFQTTSLGLTPMYLGDTVYG
jgi:hypothetical protein